MTERESLQACLSFITSTLTVHPLLLSKLYYRQQQRSCCFVLSKSSSVITLEMQEFFYAGVSAWSSSCIPWLRHPTTSRQDWGLTWRCVEALYLTVATGSSRRFPSGIRCAFYCHKQTTVILFEHHWCKCRRSCLFHGKVAASLHECSIVALLLSGLAPVLCRSPACQLLSFPP